MFILCMPISLNNVLNLGPIHIYKQQCFLTISNRAEMPLLGEPRGPFAHRSAISMRKSDTEYSEEWIQRSECTISAATSECEISLYWSQSSVSSIYAMSSLFTPISAGSKASSENLVTNDDTFSTKPILGVWYNLTTKKNCYKIFQIIKLEK